MIFLATPDGVHLPGRSPLANSGRPGLVGSAVAAATVNDFTNEPASRGPAPGSLGFAGGCVDQEASDCEIRHQDTAITGTASRHQVLALDVPSSRVHAD